MDRPSNDPLRELLREAERMIPLGSRWRHLNGGEYTITSIALREEDEHPCVIYSDGTLTWMRTMHNFLERTEKGRRFNRVE